MSQNYFVVCLSSSTPRHIEPHQLNFSSLTKKPTNINLVNLEIGCSFHHAQWTLLWPNSFLSMCNKRQIWTLALSKSTHCRLVDEKEKSENQKDRTQKNKIILTQRKKAMQDETCNLIVSTTVIFGWQIHARKLVKTFNKCIWWRLMSCRTNKSKSKLPFSLMNGQRRKANYIFIRQ